MTVYVDDMEAAFGRMKMCHMIADTHAELMAMAAAIGVRERWLQQGGTAQEHFDVSKTMRARAVERGAVEVTMLELARMTYGRRDEAGRVAYYGSCSALRGDTSGHIVGERMMKGGREIGARARDRSASSQDGQDQGFSRPSCGDPPPVSSPPHGHHKGHGKT